MSQRLKPILWLILLLTLTTLACGLEGDDGLLTTDEPQATAPAESGETADRPTPTIAQAPTDEADSNPEPAATATEAPADEAEGTAADDQSSTDTDDTTPESDNPPPTPAENTTDDSSSDPGSEASSTFSLDSENSFGQPLDFDSYRMTMTFTSTVTGANNSGTGGSITIEAAYDASLNATTFTVNAEGLTETGGFGGESFTFTQVESTTYFLLPDGSCLSFEDAPTEVNPFAIFVDQGGVLGNLEGAELASSETEMINGVSTYHYTFNEENLNTADSTTPDISSVNGDVYIAVEGGYLVRAVMAGSGTSTLLNNSDNEGEIYYEINYFDFNEPVDIQIPTDCLSANPPS